MRVVDGHGLAVGSCNLNGQTLHQKFGSHFESGRNKENLCRNAQRSAFDTFLFRKFQFRRRQAVDVQFGICSCNKIAVRRAEERIPVTQFRIRQNQLPDGVRNRLARPGSDAFRDFGKRTEIVVDNHLPGDAEHDAVSVDTL